MSIAIERLVEKRVREWEAKQRASAAGPAAHRRPVITLARNRGSGGLEVARRLGEILGMDVYDQEIVDEIARHAHTYRALVESLDERLRSAVQESVAEMLVDPGFKATDYFAHLCEIVLTLAHQGDAIIVGRGANFIVPAPQRFAARLTAPVEERVQRVMQLEGCDEARARSLIAETDRERRAFARRYFNADAEAAEHYEAVFNALRIGFEGTARTLAEAYTNWRRGRREVKEA